MKKFITFSTALLLLMLSIDLLGQVGTGKLAGSVVDRETKEELIGANVVILNTSLGAAADLDGNYFILNITPGTYDVQFSYVGYGNKIVRDVQIVGGVTVELNIELNAGLQIDEIVVTDEKFFEEKSTNTVKVISSDDIQKLPVKGVANVASLQAGVVIAEGSGGADGNANINIRGGRSSEVMYIVDGIPQNNLYNRGSAAQVSDAAIEQISFQVGGYEAKYGRAQSGIINVTTKSGKPHYSIFADVVSSSFTDDYGYNLYTVNLSGPIIPGIPEHTIFVSGERGWFQDADPSAINLEFPSIDKTYESRPNNPAGVYRFTGRTNHSFGDFNARLGAIINTRNAKAFDFYSAKQNSRFFDEFDQMNYSFSSRISQNVSANTFWNLSFGYKMFEFERYNPFFEDDLFAYGDSTRWSNELGVTLLGDGRRTDSVDDNGIFRPYGYSTGLYQNREDNSITGDFDLTSQIDNHLIEFGGGVAYHIIRGYGIYPQQLASRQFDDLTTEEKFENLQPYAFGYDITHSRKTTLDDPSKFLRPRNPLLGYVYLQDRFELEDLVLNVGFRLDYFDIKSNELKNPALPYAGGSDPNGFDDDDFKTKDVEIEFSPRIGLGFPVTESTVFHAQYGRFIQVPELNDLYSGPYDYDQFVTMEPQFGQNGGLISEETIQYEVGFRQMLGNNSAMNITLFYKNIKGLVNVQNNQFRRTEGGEILNAIYPVNADFGTTKGLAFSLDITRLSYFSVSAQYTFSIAEGTGSSTSSSQTAVFRNNDRAAPKVIAPLDFDQTHTGVVNVDFFIPKDELGFMELFNANFVLSFASGRPYTPLDFYNILSANNGGPSTTGYVNSRTGPGTFRIDLRLEKTFEFGDFSISPYVWIQNLLDTKNIVNVWRSTGSATTTAWLNTAEGKAAVANQGEGFAQDYRSLENNPGNFGIPRLINLGLRVRLDRIVL